MPRTPTAGTSLLAAAGMGGESAVFFDRADCAVDLNGNGLVNGLDFLAFLNLWAGGHANADWNRDGSINALGFLAYLNDWVAGC